MNECGAHLQTGYWNFIYTQVSSFNSRELILASGTRSIQSDGDEADDALAFCLLGRKVVKYHLNFESNLF